MCIRDRGGLYQNVYTWIEVGSFKVELALRLDTLSAVMVLVITFVGALIHIYSTGYMAEEPRYAAYFGYLNLFTGAMLILVLGNNLPVMFIGWEGVGIYSTGYMAEEPRYAAYFGYLNLFTGAMLILVLGNNLPVMFIGWEGVGLCSYLLIGFWFTEEAYAYAGRKAVS